MKTDKELLSEFLAGNGEASFKKIIDRHKQMVYGVCMRVLGNAHDAEDACQAVFIILFQKAGSVRNKKHIAAWLHTVARNAAFRIICKRKSEERHRQVKAEIASGHQPWYSIHELKGILDRELDRLPARYREVITLRYLEGMSKKETAALTGIPEGTVGTYTSRGFKRLKKRISKAAAIPGVVVLEPLLEAERAVSVPSGIAENVLNVCTDSASASHTVSFSIAEATMKSMTLIKITKAAAALLTLLALVCGGVFAAVQLQAEEPAGNEGKKIEMSGKAADTALGRLAASLKPGEMKQLKTIGLTKDLVNSWYGWEWKGHKGARSKYGAQKMFNIFTGGWANDGKWDPKTRQVLFIGIGHYASMKFVTYSADTNTWTLEPVPMPLDPRNPKAVQCPGKPGHKTWGRGHTYDLMAIDPGRRRFVLRWSKGLNVYHIDNKKWKLVSNLGLGWQLAKDQIEYFPEMNGYVCGKGARVLLCTPPAAKGTKWKKRSLGSAGGFAMHGVMEYNPVHTLVVFGGGTPRGNLWRLDAKGKLKKLKPPPGCIACVSGAKFMCDPVSGEYVVQTERTKKKKSKAYAFHPVRDEWQPIPKIKFPNGVAVAVDTYGVIMICTPGRVYVYKHKPVWPEDVPGKDSKP